MSKLMWMKVHYNQLKYFQRFGILKKLYNIFPVPTGTKMFSKKFWKGKKFKKSPAGSNS